MSSNENSPLTPNMMNPEEAFKGVWDILGIDRTKDRLTIKKAYSALAKKTHPEEDPEGFQKLHNAYKGALIYASIPESKGSKEVTSEEKKEEETFDFPDVSLTTDEEEKVEDDGLDFSFVDNDELSTPRMIEDAIVNFKANNGLDSVTSFKMLAEGNRKRLTEILFSQYCNLAVASKDVSVWDIFFQERLVQWYLPDEAFRRFLENTFREGDPNRDKLIALNTKYEESLPSPVPAQPVSPAPAFAPKDKRPGEVVISSRPANKSLIVFQIVVNLFCIALVAIPIIILNYSNMVFTPRMVDALIGFCISIGIVLVPLALVANIAAFRDRRARKGK